MMTMLQSKCPLCEAGTLRGYWIPHNCLEEFKLSQPTTVTLQLEADPNGVAQHEPGAKLDAGKCDVGLLFESFPNALQAVAEVATFGAAKYTRNGWKSVPDGIRRYAAAAGRHLLKRYMGETVDKDSKLPHRYHEAWNALAQLELSITEGK